MHMVLETTSILPSGSTLYTNAVSLEMSDEPIMFYHGLMRLFVIVAFVVAGSVMVSAQRFETHKVCLSDNGDIKNIKINFAEPHQTLH